MELYSPVLLGLHVVVGPVVADLRYPTRKHIGLPLSRARTAPKTRFSEVSSKFLLLSNDGPYDARARVLLAKFSGAGFITASALVFPVNVSCFVHDRQVTTSLCLAKASFTATWAATESLPTS